MQPPNVPTRAGKHPFCACFRVPTEQKLSEAHTSFEISDDRLNRTLAASIDLPSLACLQSVVHDIKDGGARFGQLGVMPVLETPMVLFTSERDQWFNAKRGAALDVQLAEIAGIRNEDGGLPNRKLREIFQCRLEFLLVACFLREVGTNDQHRIDINGKLPIVCLDEAISTWHNIGIFVSQIELGIISLLDFVPISMALKTTAIRYFKFRALGIGFRAFGLFFGYAFGFANANAFDGRFDSGDAIFSAFKFGRKLELIAGIFAIRLFRQFQHALRFPAKAPLQFPSALEAQCVVLGGIRTDLRSVNAHRTDFQQAALAGNNEQLPEDVLQLWQESRAEIRDRIVVRMRVRSNESKRHRFVRRHLNLARCANTRCVAVEQQRDKHFRMVGRTSATRITLAQHAKIKLINKFDDEARKMSLWQPILHARRHQEHRLTIKGAKVA